MARICKQKITMVLCIMVFNAVTKYRRCNMSFSSKDKLYLLKEYSLQRILMEFSMTNCKKEAPTKGMRLQTETRA